jgi:agmatine deiminase
VQRCKTWQEAMPGYTVKGFTYALKDEPFLDKNTKNKYSSGYGWNHGDALHCRTRAVWDRDMLFISTKRIEKPKDSNQKNIVYTTIIDYSKKGILKDKTLLYWRISGENNWRSVVLNATENPTHFYGEIPFNNKGYTIEYYISAESNLLEKKHSPEQHRWVFIP